MAMSSNRLKFVVVCISALAGVLLLCVRGHQGAPRGEDMVTVVSGKPATTDGPKLPTAPCDDVETASLVEKGHVPAAVVPDTEPLPSTADTRAAGRALASLPLPDTSPFTGNFTDLSPQEERTARDIFMRERAKWARFEGLSGQLSLHFVDTATGQAESIECQVDIGPPPPEDNKSPAGKLVFYEITLKDKEGRWSAVINGRARPRIQCEDAALRATIARCILQGGILEAFDMPRRTLSQLELGDNVSGGGSDPKRFFELRQAFHSRVEGFTDAPDSYMFDWTPGVGEVLAFTDGRFCYWGDKGRLGQQQARLYYKDYEPIDGFDFPTSIEGHLRSQMVEMKFSKCKITTSH
jgi:hypothetical protein